MAEKYIINMPLKTTPDDTDLMIIEDAQDTKRMTWANIVKPIEDLVDNTFAAHLAESASKHIHSSGSNANGYYVRFDDGTQMCYRQSPVNYQITTRQTFSLPAAFVSVHAISVFPINVIVGDTQIKCDATAFKAHNGSSWEIVIREVGFSPDVGYGFFAIGRWK